ncbi:hypothetical protein BKA62DRAFT_755707 [Auriculariales sp. MPI-PUGE-AT-0066]|nr:hypothetical protein BKA62DRAFT_755707 [Auriculariales sp. MPI-PUGE-AT-0066]
MDEDKCMICGHAALAGRLYCSDRCRELDGDMAAVPIVASRPVRPPPINTYSYPATTVATSRTRRSSRSIDISTSDMDSSAASCTSSATRTSPPSSLAGDLDLDEDEELDANKFYARYPATTTTLPAAPRRQSTTACSPAASRLTFARRPSQTNSRAMLPSVMLAGHGHHHRRHASLADPIPPPSKSSSPRTQLPRPQRSPIAHTPPPPVAWRMSTIDQLHHQYPLPVKPARKQHSHASLASAKHVVRQSLPASLSRVLAGVGMSPAPSPPLQPLVTITNVDMTGAFSSSSVSASTSNSVPLDRSASQATVTAPRQGRTTVPRPLFPLKAAPEDPAVDGDEEDIERVTEPLRGRARTRTRRESTQSAVRRRDTPSPHRAVDSQRPVVVSARVLDPHSLGILSATASSSSFPRIHLIARDIACWSAVCEREHA